MIGRTVLFSLLLYNSFKCQSHPDVRVDSLMETTLTKIVNHFYDSAYSEINIFKSEYSEIPIGNLYEAALLIAKSIDYGIPFEEEKIDSLLRISNKQCDKLLEKKSTKLWTVYYKALSTGYYSYYNLLNKNYLAAFSWASESNSYYKDCLEIDSTFYEAQGAIGSYQYWMGDKTSVFNWLPLIPDKREQGILNLETAFKKVQYSRAFTGDQLFWVYVNEERFDDALELSELLIEEFPESRNIRFLYAHILSIKKDVSAIGEFTRILNSYPVYVIENNLKRIELKKKIAELHFRFGNYQEAFSVCNNILSIDNLSEYVNNRLENKLVDVKELKDRAFERINKTRKE
ncbi:MAG: hypothetical protein JEY94_15790 [Melioribacteraceae bacterium]|nr:hypothetical protein [Melioribacteraceae bacterium]